MTNKQRTRGQLITGVEPGSIGEEMGLESGDRLLAVNDKPVKDVFQYRLATLDGAFALTILRRDGEIWDLEIERGEGEDLGLAFEDPMMSHAMNCHNKCLFCFIDQLPEGMRETLYFKDDDMRLSFLTGNYVTLTNISEDELDRLISYHLSPMNVSVHATNPELRKRLLNNRFADQLMPRLRKIAAAGIELNLQNVIIPGMNDGEELERTLTDLAALGGSVRSIAAVPVGVTRYRQERGLVPLDAFSPSSAQAMIDLTERWQAYFLRERGSRVFFIADEFYCLAKAPIPPAEAYEGYPQLENGVGMLASFIEDLNGLLEHNTVETSRISGDVRRTVTSERLNELHGHNRVETAREVHLVTGTLFAPYLKELLEGAAEHYGLELHVDAIRNTFFGETVTVAGLVTGGDIARQLEVTPRDPGLADHQQPVVLIPDVMLRDEGDLFLDDTTPLDLATALDQDLRVVEATAAGLLTGLAEIAGEGQPVQGYT